MLRARPLVRRLAAAAPPRRFGGTKPVVQDAPYLFGEVPGHHKSEGWEGIMLATTVGTVLFFGLYSHAPESRIKVWAREEAEARLAREDAGLPVEYGRHYASEAAQRTRQPKYVRMLGKMTEVSDEEEVMEDEE
ncbi:unnamed protein product [Phaeothamnion confervicola]